MRILVTGAEGYLGSVLCPKLSDMGHGVAKFGGRVEHDDEWEHLDIFDAVIHLAAQNDLYYAEQYPNIDFETNYWGTVLAARYCRRVEAKLIFTSTDTVTGLAGVPMSVYDKHKLAAEFAVMSMPDLSAVVLRLSTVYGPSPTKSSQSNRGIINRWIRMALNNETIKVYDSVAECRRDYVYVDDVAYALVASLSARRGVYHICTGHGTTIRDMADLIAQTRQSSGGVQIVPGPDGLHPIEQRTRIGSPNFTDDWTPTVGVAAGVKKTAAYYAGQ